MCSAVLIHLFGPRGVLVARKKTSSWQRFHTKRRQRRPVRSNPALLALTVFLALTNYDFFRALHCREYAITMTDVLRCRASSCRVHAGLVQRSAPHAIHREKEPAAEHHLISFPFSPPCHSAIPTDASTSFDDCLSAQVCCCPKEHRDSTGPLRKVYHFFCLSCHCSLFAAARPTNKHCPSFFGLLLNHTYKDGRRKSR